VAIVSLLPLLLLRLGGRSYWPHLNRDYFGECIAHFSPRHRGPDAHGMGSMSHKRVSGGRSGVLGASVHMVA
jgi:hypothetical protein